MNVKKLLSLLLVSGMLAAQGCLVTANNMWWVSYGEDNADDSINSSQFVWFPDIFDQSGGFNSMSMDNTGIWGADNNLLDDTPYNVVIIDKCKNTVLNDKDKKEFTKNKVIRLDTNNASWLYTIGGQSINQKLLNGLDLGIVVTDFKDKASVDTLKMLDGPKNVLSNFKNTPLLICLKTDQKLPLVALVEIYLKDIQPGEYVPYCVYATEDGEYRFVKKDKITIGKNKKVRVRIDNGRDFILVKENDVMSLKSYETK